VYRFLVRIDLCNTCLFTCLRKRWYLFKSWGLYLCNRMVRVIVFFTCMLPNLLKQRYLYSAKHMFMHIILDWCYLYHTDMRFILSE